MRISDWSSDVCSSDLDERRAKLHNVRPNAAHEALARLDAAWRGELLIVTQNVDDLHERAGAKRMLHMHGELQSALCAACGNAVKWEGDMPLGSVCGDCGAPKLRPDIVFFGEMRSEEHTSELQSLMRTSY